MAEIVCIRVDWDRGAIPLRIAGYHAVHILPEPGYPFGRRGNVLASAWRQLGGPKVDGMLMLDGDVAVDPADHAAMLAAIHAEPPAIHTAPVRLWPVSTHRPGWVFGHGRGDFTAEDTDDPDVFSFCYTYLPRALITSCIEAGLDRWTYPGVDKRACQRAQALGIPVRVVRGASPKHLNF